MDADKRERTPRGPHGTHPSDQTLDPTLDPAPDQTRPQTRTEALEQGPRAAGDAATQLQLLDDAHLPDWRLDPSTKAIGLHGIAQARAALRTARRRRADLETSGEAHRGRATAA